MARPAVLRNEVAHPVDDGGPVRGVTIRKPHVERDGTRILAQLERGAQGADDSLECTCVCIHSSVHPLGNPAVDLDVAVLEEHDSVGALDLLRPRELVVVTADRTARISDRHVNRFSPWRAAPNVLRSAGNLPIRIEEMDAVLDEDASALLRVPLPVIDGEDLCEVLERE